MPPTQAGGFPVLYSNNNQTRLAIPYSTKYQKSATKASNMPAGTAPHHLKDIGCFSFMLQRLQVILGSGRLNPLMI